MAVQRYRPSLAGRPAHHLSVIDGGDLPPPPPYRLAGRSSRPTSYRAGFRISQTTTPGTGMSTRCPSAIPRGYALGPTNPPRIIRAAEPSGLRWGGFLPPLYVTHPDIRTRQRSTAAYATASTPCRRSPTTPASKRQKSSASVPCLSPDTLSAPDHSTSELLRTLSRVAASKPTSWLSQRPDCLSH